MWTESSSGDSSCIFDCVAARMGCEKGAVEGRWQVNVSASNSNKVLDSNEPLQIETMILLGTRRHIFDTCGGRWAVGVGPSTTLGKGAWQLLHVNVVDFLLFVRLLTLNAVNGFENWQDTVQDTGQ